MRSSATDAGMGKHRQPSHRLLPSDGNSIDSCQTRRLYSCRVWSANSHSFGDDFLTQPRVRLIARSKAFSSVCRGAPARHPQGPYQISRAKPLPALTRPLDDSSLAL